MENMKAKALKESIMRKIKDAAAPTDEQLGASKKWKEEHGLGFLADMQPSTQDEYMQEMAQGVSIGGLNKVGKTGLDMLKKAKVGAGPVNAGDTLISVEKSAMGEPGKITYGKQVWGQGSEAPVLDYSIMNKKKLKK